MSGNILVLYCLNTLLRVQYLSHGVVQDKILKGSFEMLKRIILRTTLVVVLIVSAIAIPACQTTGKVRSEMLTGDTQLTHERHAKGIDSHTADKK